MRLSALRRAAVSAALAVPLALVATSALASESLEVKSGEKVYLEGTVRYDTVTVRSGGTLIVRGMTDGAPGAGSLTLKANSVTVEEGGTIDARGAGFPGTNASGAAPACCSTAAGGVGPMGTEPTPGGGGASGGDGAAGCTGGGAGGMKFMTPATVTPGAAGGASFFPNAPQDIPNRGGNGGGSVTILAALVTIDGAILADGAPGLSYGGVGTGGGAGGYISIDAFSVLGGGALSAQGGPGGVGFAASGGGGGGGIIQVSSTLDLPTDAGGGILPSRDVSGGPTGAAGSTCPTGGPGVANVLVDPAKPCIDADEDGDPAAVCQGTDCDDSDATVRGGSKPGIEVCDGQDNDCDGNVDNDLVKDACPEDQVCEGGTCTAESTGSGGGSATGDSPPDYLDYRGSCDMNPRRSPHTNGMIFFATALVGFLAGLRAHKNRKNK